MRGRTSNLRSLALGFLEPDTAQGLQLGLAACKNELGIIFSVLRGAPYTYERKTIKKAKEFDFNMELDFNIQAITLGGAPAVKYTEAYEYAVERGLGVANGPKRPLATYDYDKYVRQDTHTLTGLLGEVLSGLWSTVASSMDYGSWTIARSTAWVVNLAHSGGGQGAGLHAAGAEQPWAQLTGPAYCFSSQLQLSLLGFPADPNPFKGLTVVGECLSVQPEDIKASKPLTLTIEADPADMPAGLEAAALGVYRWHGGRAGP